MRAGAYGLSLLADPLDAQSLIALESGPLPLIDLRRALGSPPQTTLRKHLHRFADLGVLTRVQQSGFPGEVAYEMGPAGPDLLDTLRILSAWLATSPDGPLAIGGTAAKSAVKAFIGGWSSNILRALAARPLSLTELDRLISGINYPALERRLAAMRLTGQIVPARNRAGSTPYKVTRWLRQAVGPLVTAAEWERRWAGQCGEPLRRHDIEATFLLAIPLLDLPGNLNGLGRLAVEISEGDQSTIAGVVVSVEDGRPISCRSDLHEDVESSASGSAEAWLNALRGRDSGVVASGSDTSVADALVTGLRQALICPKSRTGLLEEHQHSTRIGASGRLLNVVQDAQRR